MSSNGICIVIRKYMHMVRNQFDDVYEESLKTLALSTLAAGAIAGGIGAGVYNQLVDPLAKVVHVLDSPATGAETNSDVGESTTYNGLSKAFIKAALQYIAPSEGIKDRAYRDSKGNWTIGIGHLVLPGEHFNRVLTAKEILDLFVEDLKEHQDRARRIVPQYDQYPQYIKLAVLDGVYRGDLVKSPMTLKLIQANRWTEAAREYVNNREYKQSKRLGSKSGIWGRMDRNANMFSTYGNMIAKK